MLGATRSMSGKGGRYLGVADFKLGCSCRGVSVFALVCVESYTAGYLSFQGVGGGVGVCDRGYCLCGGARCTMLMLYDSSCTKCPQGSGPGAWLAVPVCLPELHVCAVLGLIYHPTSTRPGCVLCSAPYRPATATWRDRHARPSPVVAEQAMTTFGMQLERYGTQC